MKNLSLLLNAAGHRDPRAAGEQRFAMVMSLSIGFLMLGGKVYAFLITGSAAILSDAVESVVHVFAVGFAAFSLWLSQRPPDSSHPYGHEKISFFSAGAEGGLIFIAAVSIIYTAVDKWLSGLALEHLSTGTLLVAGAALVNALLGGFLIRKGKRTGSIILIANGKHVLTDVWTSTGVVIGLVLTLVTGWLPFDPIVAILAALNIIRSGTQLIRQSVGGLMDEGDPEIERLITEAIAREAQARGVGYHNLRYRSSGTSLWVDVHLLFGPGIRLDEAHAAASAIEAAVLRSVPVALHFTSHLEPMDEHDEAHARADVPHR
ncbi:MAG: cation diffusion facilitator family transporter [Bacteroidota bacterium]